MSSINNFNVRDDLIAQGLNDLDDLSWKDFYSLTKKTRFKYRRSLKDTSFKLFSLNNYKSKVKLYYFV